jgi:hypothetical protein
MTVGKDRHFFHPHNFYLIMEITLEKSEQFAHTFNQLKPHLLEVDVDYIKEAAKQMREKANFNDSAAVLNRMYLPSKQDCIRKQAESLQHLANLIECLKEVDKLKLQVAAENYNLEKINNLFS